MDNCLFCKIINKEIDTDIVFENDRLIAFQDINPQAPLHILIIPKKHIPTLNDLETSDKNLVGELIITASELAQKEGFDKAGYRTVFNCNEMAGQTVYHIHLHLIAGRYLTWPPG